MPGALGGLDSGIEKKLGPLPIWAWGAIFGGAFYLYMRKRAATAAATLAASATPAPTDASSTDATGAIDPATGIPYSEEADNGGFDPNSAIDQYLGQDPTNSAYPVGSIAQGVPAPVTNAQWARLAADYLQGQGDDPSLVQTALSKYLAGTALSASEQSIVNLALQAFGTPPEGVLPVTSAPPTTGSGGAKPGSPVKFPNQIHRVGTPGKTYQLPNLIKQYYPNATPQEQAEIDYATAAANPKLGAGVPGGTEVTFVSQQVK